MSRHKSKGHITDGLQGEAADRGTLVLVPEGEDLKKRVDEGTANRLQRRVYKKQKKAT